MKTLLGALLLISFTGLFISAQEYNRVVVLEGSNTEILLGACNRDAFAMPEFQSWFEMEYEMYEPAQDIVAQLNLLPMEEISFTIFLGTWCPDSRREVPRFFRIIDDLEVADDAISMFGLDRNKSMPGKDVTGLDVYFVPTFILYRDGVEIGRIVEMPETTIEADILGIMGQG